MASERVGLLQGWGGREGSPAVASRGPRAVIVSLSLSMPAPGSAVPRVPTWGEGEVPGACQLGCHSVRLAGDRARGCPPRCPLRALLSHLTRPSPPHLLAPALGSFPFTPCLHPALLTRLPAQLPTCTAGPASRPWRWIRTSPPACSSSLHCSCILPGLWSEGHFGI